MSATFTSFTHVISFSATLSDGALSWTSIQSQEVIGGITVRDSNGDGNLDRAVNGDSLQYNSDFSGYYYLAPNGQTYAIFIGAYGSGYRIPYNAADYDLAAHMEVPGSTALFQDTDFAPTGNPVCFLPGTAIATPAGEVAVEQLAIGDLVTTAEGRAVPVRFVLRQTIATRFGPPERLQPVRVRAGALGGGLPLRDLVLTADHALLIDGLLINAGALVNGAGIDWVPLSELGDTYTVYHIETEEHDIILAEGAPAETFIDYVGRQSFDNYAEYVALYGEERLITEAPYPRISTPRLLPPALKARLAGAVAA